MVMKSVVLINSGVGQGTSKGMLAVPPAGGNRRRRGVTGWGQPPPPSPPGSAAGPPSSPSSAYCSVAGPGTSSMLLEDALGGLPPAARLYSRKPVMATLRASSGPLAHLLAPALREAQE